MERKFKSVDYAKLGERTTVCCLVNESGFEVVGAFCCKASMKDDDKFREGKAYESALRALERSESRRNSTKED